MQADTKLADTILYILGSCPVRPGKTMLLKLLFLADYYHYVEHLQPITGADYVALPNGPVIDNYDDVFDELERENLIKTERVQIRGFSEPKVEFRALQAPSEVAFSVSELATLDRVVREHGRSSGKELSILTHKMGPWQLVWNPAHQGERIPYSLFRWMENLPDEDDLKAAHDAISRSPSLQARIQELESASLRQ